MVLCRKATADDMLLYFEWVNDEQVRLNSFTQDKVDLESHKKWFEKKLVDDSCVMFVASKDDKEIGQIRFDYYDDNTFEIDFSIQKDARRQHAGSALIKLGTEEFFRLKPVVKRVIGRVKKQNEPSIKSFINAGFTILDQHDSPDMEVFYFENNIYNL